MKIRILFFALLLGTIFTSRAVVIDAGAIKTTTIVPTAYYLDQPVSWTFDLTGTTFPIAGDVYLWVWTPNEPDAGNWTNSSAFAKLTNLGNMKWRMDLTPTLYFNTTAAAIRTAGRFWFRLKDKTGTMQSAVSSIGLNEPSGTSGTPITSFTVAGNSISASGVTSQMSVVLTPTNASSQPVTWSVDNSSIATISAYGLLIPKTDGTVVVTATIVQNGVTMTATKSISITNQIAQLYLCGTAFPTPVAMNLSPSLTGASSYFDFPTTLSAGKTFKFYTSQDTTTAVSFGSSATSGTFTQNGNPILPTVTGDAVIRINFANNSYAIYPNNGLKISQMGSSVSQGYGATNLYGYANQYRTLLSNRYTQGAGLNWSLSNISVGGNTTILVLNRWDNDLLNDGAKYVVYALSLANEGILSGGQEIFDQFKNNLLLLINKVRSVGKVPVIANVYPNGYYNATHYNYVKQMDLLIHQWDVPSINLLGGVDDLTGKWPLNMQFDPSHPNDAGHTEMMYTLVPSLYDALYQNKPQPELKSNTAITLSAAANEQLSFSPENIIHSFTHSFEFKTGNTGVISTLKQGANNGIISIENGTGFLKYSSPNGGNIAGQTAVNDNQWHKITLTHYYAIGVTILYDGTTEVGRINEKLLGTNFTLGGINSPTTTDYRQWMFYRAGMNADEIFAINNSKMLKSSLELYAPLDGAQVYGNDPLHNWAQSTNTVLRQSNSTGIANTKGEQNISILNNPVTSTIQLAGLNGFDYDATIYSTSGCQVLNCKIEANSIDVSVLTSNIYYLALTNRTQHDKVILKVVKR